MEKLYKQKKEDNKSCLVDIRSFFIVVSTYMYGVINPINAYADSGLPMIAITYPAFWFAFFPIVGIEFLIMKKTLSFHKNLFRNVVISNAISTIIGIPIAWFIMACIQLNLGGGGVFPGIKRSLALLLNVTLQAPWLLPLEGEQSWMIPMAFLFLLLPFFIMSYWLEYAIMIVLMEKFISEKLITMKEIKRSVWKANLYSYGFLCVVTILFVFVFLIFSSKATNFFFVRP